MDDKAEQRQGALSKANGIREARARLKAELKSGERSLGQTIMAPPGFIDNMRIGELCSAPRGFGTVRVAKLLARCELAHSKRVGKLSVRQRELLALEVEGEYQRAYGHAKTGKQLPSTPLAANMSASVQS